MVGVLPQSAAMLQASDGQASALNLNGAASVVKAAPGRLTMVHVTTAGSAAGSINDCTTTGAVAAANLVATIPNTVGMYLTDFPMLVGITVTPGTGQVISLAYT